MTSEVKDADFCFGAVYAHLVQHDKSGELQTVFVSTDHVTSLANFKVDRVEHGI